MLLLLLQPQRIPPGRHRHNAVPPFYVYGPLLGAWAWVVGAGSKAAVVAAKRI